MDSVTKVVNCRVIARSTYIAIEISTPELDDVIRWEDDNIRKSGKIGSEPKTLKLCILAAGKGSRNSSQKFYLKDFLIDNKP